MALNIRGQDRLNTKGSETLAMVIFMADIIAYASEGVSVSEPAFMGEEA